MKLSSDEDCTSIPLHTQSRECDDGIISRSPEHSDSEPLIAEHPENGEQVTEPQTVWRMLSFAVKFIKWRTTNSMDTNKCHQDNVYMKRWWLRKSISVGLIILLLL